MNFEKKVLIICYDFPPLNTVGALRPYSWYKELSHWRIYPVIITKHWPENIANQSQKFSDKTFDSSVQISEEGTIIKSAFKPDLKNRIIAKFGFGKRRFLRKILTARNSILGPLFKTFDEYNFIYEEAHKYLKQENVDLIIATGNPHQLYKEAHKLSAFFKIPWMPDYRDLYVNNHSLMVNKTNTISESYKAFLEKKWTNNAIHFTSVSKALVKNIEDNISIKGSVIRNGYDSKLIPTNKAKPAERFTITYVGTVYHSKSVDTAIEGIELFLQKNTQNDILFKFIGIELNFTEGTSKIMQLAKKYVNQIEIVNNCTNKKAIDILSNSSILLSMNYLSSSQGIVPVKIYEYLALKKLILSVETTEGKDIGEFDQYMDIVSESRTLFDRLEKYYENWKKGEDITNPIPDEVISKYSRSNQTKLLAELIHKLV